MIDSAHDTTQGHPPPMLLRRALARGIDTALALLLSALVVWPLSWGAASDVLAASGFSNALDFLRAGPTTADAGTAAFAAAQDLQPIVVSALLLQLGIVWLYETVFLVLGGATPGKGAFRMRVVPFEGSAATIAPVHPPAHRSWADRLLRGALRAALVVGPPAIAVAMLIAAALGVPEATELAEVSIALSLVLVVVWFAGGRGAHGILTGTTVAPFSWQQVRQAGEDYLREQTADPARRRQVAEAGERARRAGERQLQQHPEAGSLRDLLAERFPGLAERAETWLRGTVPLPGQQGQAPQSRPRDSDPSGHP